MLTISDWQVVFGVRVEEYGKKDNELYETQRNA